MLGISYPQGVEAAQISKYLSNLSSTEIVSSAVRFYVALESVFFASRGGMFLFNWACNASSTFFEAGLVRVVFLVTARFFLIRLVMTGRLFFGAALVDRLALVTNITLFSFTISLARNFSIDCSPDRCFYFFRKRPRSTESLFCNQDFSFWDFVNQHSLIYL